MDEFDAFPSQMRPRPVLDHHCVGYETLHAKGADMIGEMLVPGVQDESVDEPLIVARHRDRARLDPKLVHDLLPSVP
ncbi:hypothetical protein [Afifella pfennigii]|uniref:hypothetical protein n=1 Tax=Afifella pfennigii TaxID=209897 RepID=UPI000479A137|nr:hypothetical protein [Afifella pfennigii]